MGIWLCRVPKLPHTSTLLWLHNSLYSHLENRKLVSSVLMSISYNCHLFQSYSIRINSLILFAETECAKLIRKLNPLCVWNCNRKYNICTTNAMIYDITSHSDLWDREICESVQYLHMCVCYLYLLPSLNVLMIILLQICSSQWSTASNFNMNKHGEEFCLKTRWFSSLSPQLAWNSNTCGRKNTPVMGLVPVEFSQQEELK